MTQREDIKTRLKAAGIRPSAQRVVVAEHVLTTDVHPSAEQILEAVRGAVPVISRATVYNTLALFVEKGLLRRLVLTEGRVVFDPHVAPHHHLIDEETGVIADIPWSALEVRGVDALEGVDVDDYQVVVHGRRR